MHCPFVCGVQITSQIHWGLQIKQFCSGQTFMNLPRKLLTNPWMVATHHLRNTALASPTESAKWTGDWSVIMIAKNFYSCGLWSYASSVTWWIQMTLLECYNNVMTKIWWISNKEKLLQHEFSCLYLAADDRPTGRAHVEMLLQSFESK